MIGIYSTPLLCSHYSTSQGTVNVVWSVMMRSVLHLTGVGLGFGFGKTLEHNYTLLKKLSYFHALQRPILVGLSRKGMIQKVIGSTAEMALNGTTAAHVLAIQNGANILRVHDVKEAKEAIQIVDFYQKQ